MTDKDLKLLEEQLNWEEYLFQEELERKGIPADIIYKLDLRHILSAYSWMDVDVEEHIDTTNNNPMHYKSRLSTYIIKDRKENALDLLAQSVEAIKGYQVDGEVEGKLLQIKENLVMTFDYAMLLNHIKPDMIATMFDDAMLIHQINTDRITEYFQEEGNYETLRTTLLEFCEAYDQKEKNDDNIFADKPEGMGNVDFIVNLYQKIEEAKNDLLEHSNCQVRYCCDLFDETELNESDIGWKGMKNA